MIVKMCAFVLESQSFFIVCLFVTKKKKSNCHTLFKRVYIMLTLTDFSLAI